jgi:hypothetical protein
MTYAFTLIRAVVPVSPGSATFDGDSQGTVLLRHYLSFMSMSDSAQTRNSDFRIE